MNADLELQVHLVARILGKKPQDVIDDAVRLFCRSIAGQKDHHGRPARVIDAQGRTAAAEAAAKRASDSPGSLEGRLVAFVRKHGSVKPGALAAALKTDIHTSRRAVHLLAAAGVLQVTGTTMSRRIALA